MEIVKFGSNLLWKLLNLGVVKFGSIYVYYFIAYYITVFNSLV